MTTEPGKFTRSIPVVPVAPYADGVAFYRDVLGFTVLFEQGDYAGVRRDDIELHLNGYGGDAAGSCVVRLQVHGVDELFAALASRVTVDEPLETKPWGTRQFTIHDASENHLTFVEEA
jgi:uncharacterized glyoxalase superfamily protein PhnB